MILQHKGASANCPAPKKTKSFAESARSKMRFAALSNQIIVMCSSRNLKESTSPTFPSFLIWGAHSWDTPTQRNMFCLFCVFNFQLPITIFGSRLYLNCCPSGRRFIASLPHARGACRILPSWIPPKTLQVDPLTVEIRHSHDSMMTFDDSSGDKTTLVKTYRGEN